MRILICNDDGHQAPGLHALERAARAFSNEVITVAPDAQRSSAGHSISLHGSFTLTKLDESRYACSGTPADCAIAGIAGLGENAARPALVLSGINHGRNVGEDIAYSGTMSIAREASFWGIPAVAFSSLKDIDFTAPGASEWLELLVRRLASDTDSWHQPDTWLTINLPSAIPAVLRPAMPGRAKIAPGVIVQRRQGDQTTLCYPEGRRGAMVRGDDTSQIEAGFAVVYRLRWNEHHALADPLLQDLNRALNVADDIAMRSRSIADSNAETT